MGMFDEIRCHYPLPVPVEDMPEIKDAIFQTKDTPEQWLDMYEIREDGTLWHEAYDIEDQSEKGKTGLGSMAGCMTRVNKRWEPEDFTGEIQFYHCYGKDYQKWVEFSACFVNGKINQQIRLLEHRK